jgi:hypothetical protein
MTKTERKIENLKKRVRTYCNMIGFKDYDIIFIAKKKGISHQEKTIQGVEEAEWWINRIYDALKINLREKDRNQEILLYRQATSYILKKRGVKNLAIAKALGQCHTTVSHTIQVSSRWIEVQDPVFMPYFSEIENFFNEFENEKLC